jgi:hypothetical protein
MDVIGETRHEIAGFIILKVAQRQFLQMQEYPVAEIRFTTARETVDIDTPAIPEKPLKSGGEQNQQRVLNQRALGVGVQRRIDAAFDQPRQRDAGKISADEREKPEQ